MSDQPERPGNDEAAATWRDVKDLIATGVTAGSRSVAKSQRSLIQRITAEVGRLTGKADALAALGDAVWLPFALSHAQVRLVTQLSSWALDAADERLPAAWLSAAAPPSDALPVPMRSDVTQTRAWAWDGFLGLVNGLVGDHLVEVDNPLALPMTLRLGDASLTLESVAGALAVEPAPLRRVVVFVHGLTATEWSWAWDAEAVHGAADATYASLLLDDPGSLALFVRYNTGRHISDNGQALSRLLEAAMPPLAARGQPELSLVGHSMGGLVARSAAHYGDAAGASWVRSLRQVITLGAPHQGAPLEQLGHVAARVLAAIGLPGTQVPADIIESRSAGIQDLRRGAIVAEDWAGAEGRRRPSVARWLPGVAYHRVAATLAQDPASASGRLVGDTMVQPSSALAMATRERPANAGAVSGEPATEPGGGDEGPQGDIVTLGGIPHVALANHPDVVPYLRRWLTPAGDAPAVS